LRVFEISANASGIRWTKASAIKAPTAKLTRTETYFRNKSSRNDKANTPTSDMRPTMTTLIIE